MGNAGYFFRRFPQWDLPAVTMRRNGFVSSQHFATGLRNRHWHQWQHEGRVGRRPSQDVEGETRTPVGGTTAALVGGGLGLGLMPKGPQLPLLRLEVAHRWLRGLCRGGRPPGNR